MSRPSKQQWIRQQPCCIPNCVTGLPIEAAHIRTAANSGTGKKPSDDYLVPMCRLHHKMQHQTGHQHTLEHATGRKWERFEAKDWFLDQCSYYNRKYLKENYSL